LSKIESQKIALWFNIKDKVIFKVKNMTKITDIELIPIRAKDGLTFFASCVLDEKFFVGNLAIFTLRDGSGFRVVFPTKMLRNGQQIPIFYPINSEISSEIQQAISNEATKLLTPNDYQITQSKGGDENGSTI
jgi:DNA-binding cell septation regulator SpoVG